MAVRELFDQLCLPLRPKMLAHATRLTAGNTQRAEDIVQDSLIRAWKAWPEWEPSGEASSAASAWLYRIVTNTYMNEYAARQSRKRTLQAAQREFPIFATAYEEPATDFGPEVTEALGQLFSGFREVVEMHYVRGMKCTEIALELNIPVGSVLSRLSRARKALQPLLAKHARQEYGFRLDDDVELHRARKNAAVVESEAAHLPETDADGVDGVVAGDDGSAFVGAQLA